MFIFRAIFWMIRSVLSPRAALLVENLALRQQLVVSQRSVKRPNFPGLTDDFGSGCLVSGRTGNRSCSSFSRTRSSGGTGGGNPGL
jgi:hypothetical protein